MCLGIRKERSVMDDSDNDIQGIEIATFYNYRLPMVQGGSFAFLTPTFAIMSLPKWTCPKPDGQS